MSRANIKTSFVLLTICVLFNSSIDLTAQNVTYADGNSAPVGETPWPMFQQNPQLTGQSLFVGPESPRVKWKFVMLGAGLYATPIIDSDGNIYVVSDFSLSVINSDGAPKWRLPVIDPSPSVALGRDETIYLGSDNHLIAANSSGQIIWRYSTNGDITSPIIGPDGTIYVGSEDENIYAINPDGTLKWQYKTHHEIDTSPAIGTDGSIILGVGFTDDRLYSISSNGELNWVLDNLPGLADISSPAIGTDGTIYVNTFFNILFAFSPNGDKKWEISRAEGGVGGGELSSPAIGNDGTIYSISNDGTLNAVNPNGTIKWRFSRTKTSGQIISSPAIDADGTIYFTSRDRQLFGVKSDGTFKWSFSGASSMHSPALDAEGNIYVQTTERLYVLEENRALEISVSSIGFGSVGIGDTAEQNLILRNNLNSSLAIHSLALVGADAGEFAINTQANTIAPYDSMSIDIAFSPSSVGRKEALLIVNSNASSSPDTVRLAGLAGTSVADSARWPMFQRDLKNSGLAPFEGIESPQIKWRFEAEDVLNAAVIGSNGSVYAASDTKLYAINPDGTLKWTSPYGTGNYPAVDFDGAVYTLSGGLSSINSDGTLKWRTEALGTQIAIGSDRTIYFASNSRFENPPKLYAFNPNGSLKWASRGIENTVGVAPAVASDGTLYYAGGDSLYAVSVDGRVKWSFGADSAELTSPSIGSDGSVYVGTGPSVFGTGGEMLYSVNSSGELNWALNTGGTQTTPTIGLDGTIYLIAGSNDWLGEKLMAISPDGVVKWDVDEKIAFKFAGHNVNIATDINNAIYYVREGEAFLSDHWLVARDKGGNILWTVPFDISGANTAPSVLLGSDKSIYVVGQTSELIAIGQIPTDVSDTQNMLPISFALSQNYPNPFNPTTTIRFELPKTSDVRIEIYDILGREVRTLVDGRFEAGRYSETWHGRDDSNLQVPTGTYFVRMETSDFVTVKKLVLLK